MKNLFKLVLLTFNCIYPLFSFSQTSAYQYVEDEDLRLFENNGWELFYTSDQIKIDQFAVYSEGFVTVSEIDQYKIQIELYNKSNLIVDKEEVTHSKQWLIHYPRLITYNETILICPFYKNQFYIDFDKQRIKKYRSEFLRDKSKYYKREFDLGDFRINFFNQFDENNSYLEFISLIEKDYLIDTLHYSKKKTEYLEYSDYSTNVEIIPSVDKIYILDNIQDAIFVYEFSGQLISKIPLPYTSKAKMGLLSFKMEMDNVTGKIYLFSIKESQKFWQIEEIERNQYSLVDMVIDHTNFTKIKIHNDYIYNIFYLSDREQYSIYRRQINNE